MQGWSWLLFSQFYMLLICQILGDEKRKVQYDRYGRVDETPERAGRGQQGGQFFRTPFGDFHFNGDGFRGADDNVNRITDRLLSLCV